MNLIPISGAGQTMSSREIADLTEKEHRNVVRDIENMLEQLDIPQDGYAQLWTHPQNQQQYRCYVLPEDLTLNLVAGYSAPLRLRIIRRWKELEAAPVDQLAHLPPEQRALIALMVDNASIKQVQAEHAAAMVAIEQRVDLAEETHLMLARPSASESIVHIRQRINKQYGLPIRIIDEIVRQSPYAPKPAGMVKHSREEAMGGSYAVYWIKDINTVFARFVSECRRETTTQFTHPLIAGRFKLNGS